MRTYFSALITEGRQKFDCFYWNWIGHSNLKPVIAHKFQAYNHMELLSKHVNNKLANCITKDLILKLLRLIFVLIPINGRQVWYPLKCSIDLLFTARQQQIVLRIYQSNVMRPGHCAFLSDWDKVSVINSKQKLKVEFSNKRSMWL